MELEFLVAPFEADAQMAHLARTGVVAAILSEDTDLLVVYRCPVVLDKLNEKRGTVYELGWDVIRDGIHRTRFRELQGEDLYQKMVEVCIMAERDYLVSLKGVKVITAIKLMVDHGTVKKVEIGHGGPINLIVVCMN